MKEQNIQEDEIQILGSSEETSKKKHKPIIIIASIVIVLAIVIGSIIYFTNNSETEDSANTTVTVSQSNSTPSGYIEVFEETVNDVPLYVYIPYNATAELLLERPDINDSTIVFATQAADIGTDKKTIIGDYVLKGDQISRGKSKQGFCAIIGNEISIGVSTSTSLLDEAIKEKGYFFRQYPLVSKGQMIENKPKGKAIRRALGKKNNQIVIVESRSRESFFDFAQALVDIGVTDAIYLVGGNVYGWYLNKENNINTFGSEETDVLETKNYIVWRKQPK